MTKIYIAACEKIKEGFGSGGKRWELYRITDQTGKKYSTFDGKYMGLVEQEVEVDIETKTTEKNGKTYTNHTIVEKKSFKGTDVSKDIAAIKTRLAAKFGEIEAIEDSLQDQINKINAILKQSAQQVVRVEPEDSGEETPPLPELPF